MESIRRLTHTQLLLGAAVLILVGNAFADLSGDSDVRAFVIISVVAIAIAAFLVLWLVPREEDQAGSHRPGRTALILGILAFITLVAFWTALPFALGVPALYLGALAQSRAREGRPAAAGETAEPGAEPDVETPSERAGGGEALAGTALGAAALVIGLLLCIVG